MSSQQDAVRTALRELLSNQASKAVQAKKKYSVPFEDKVELIVPYVPIGSRVTLNPIGDGRSNCETLLLLTEPSNPMIVKLGSSADINGEIHALRTCAFPSRFRQIVEFPVKYHNGFASFASYLVGNCESVRTLEGCILDERYRAPRLVDLLRQISVPLLSWRGSTIEPSRFFPHFPWKCKDKASIKQRLEIFGSATPARSDGISMLISILNGTYVSNIPRPALVNRSTSFTHGDLNPTNILIGVSPDGISLEPYVIDFASMSPPQYSWTLDWTRLERDIKLYILRLCTESSSVYRTYIKQINENGDAYPGRFNDDRSPITKCFALIKTIRQICHDHPINGTDTTIEYLYTLLCWNLSYIDSPRFKEDPDSQDIVIESALDTLDQLNSHIRSLSDPPDFPGDSTRKTFGPLQSAGHDTLVGRPSSVNVLTGWAEANPTICNAQRSILVIDSFYSEYGTLSALIRDGIVPAKEGLEIEIFMLSPELIFGAQRIRETNRQDIDSRELSSDVTGSEQQVYRGGLRFLVTMLEKSCKNSKVFVYPTMPSIRQIIVDDRHYFFGWFPLLDINPGFPCLYLDAKMLAAGDASLFRGLKRQADAIRKISERYKPT